MPVVPVDPSFATSGAEWRVDPVAPAAPASGSNSGFGAALGQALQSLQADQAAATDAVQGMVAGTTDDPTKAVMALERARLSMQLASQIRTKAVEAAQDIFHTQV
jgi:flagellar hook-basal body complex protein FliE